MTVTSPDTTDATIEEMEAAMRQMRLGIATRDWSLVEAATAEMLHLSRRAKAEAAQGGASA
jgi:hypothetical protein